MSTQTGIWIDKKQAIFIDLDGGQASMRIYVSGLGEQDRVPGGAELGKFGGQPLSGEPISSNREKGEVKQYMQEVIKMLMDSDEIVVFGPAGMKVELKKEIEANRDLAAKLKGVEPADTMTDNQLVAWVKAYFS